MSVSDTSTVTPAALAEAIRAERSAGGSDIHGPGMSLYAWALRVGLTPADIDAQLMDPTITSAALTRALQVLGCPCSSSVVSRRRAWLSAHAEEVAR